MTDRVEQIRYELTKPVQSQFIRNDCEYLLGEIERLRAALEEIVNLHDEGHAEVFSDAATDYAETARAALAAATTPAKDTT